MGYMTAATSLISQLDSFGPQAEPASPALSQDDAWRYVRELSLGHYENFSVLSRLVPEHLRDDFASVYSYCRWSDDLGDETGSDEAARERSLELLGWWRQELRRCFSVAAGETDAGTLRHPVFITLSETARRRELSIEPFEHLIDAFEQDQRVTQYETWDQLVGYCTRSADPVGRIVLALAGHNGSKPGDAELIAMSDATCTALQLTNFWQDVRRDLFERARVYLPSAETGVSPDTLRAWARTPDDPGARVPFIKALRPLVERTRGLFEKGRPLPAALAGEMSPVVWLFGAGGESVLSAVERAGCATLWSRPKLTRRRKASLVARAWWLSRAGAWRSKPGGVA